MWTEPTFSQVIEELNELSLFFNKRMAEIKEKHLTEPDALQVIKKADGNIAFSLNIDNLK